MNVRDTFLLTRSVVVLSIIQ